MGRRLLLRAAAAVAGVLLAAYAASPVFAVRSLVNAARTGDAARLERLIDFPAVRDDLKAQATRRLTEQVRNDPELRDNPFSSLGLALAPSLVGGMVDALITPEAIATIVRTAEEPDLIAGRAPPESEASKPVRIGYGYRGLDRFAGTLTDPERPERRIDLIMERRGVFQWKLASIRLPQE